MPPITPPAIAAVFDLGSKTANLKNYRNYHPLKKNEHVYFHRFIKLTTKKVFTELLPTITYINSS